MSSGLTLAGLLGGHVVVEWYEAVALVREVADRFLEHSGKSINIPELNQIHLSPEGHVDVAGGKSTDEPVRRLGQLLLALIANSEAPVQLRLVISQATAPSPTYASIREYSDALAFFERPERSHVLQALAARAGDASTPASERPPTLDSLAPLPNVSEVKEESTAKRSSRSRSRKGRFAAVAAALIFTCAGAAWYAWNRGIGPRNTADASVLADQAADKVGSALITGASAVTERLGLGRIVPGNSPAPPAPSIDPPPPAPPSSQGKRPDLPASIAPIPPPVVAFDLEGTPAAAAMAVVPAETPATEPSIGRTPDDPTIYSIASQGITPPVGIRPQLARQLPADLNPDSLGRVELIIALDGSVESAKLLGAPRTIHDGLFLSVAKAWNFQPALKDGVPVRYRKTIWIASP